jgi:hypothetical protein
VQKFRLKFINNKYILSKMAPELLMDPRELEKLAVPSGLDGRECSGCVQERVIDSLMETREQKNLYDRQQKGEIDLAEYFPEYKPSTNKEGMSFYHSEPGTS